MTPDQAIRIAVEDTQPGPEYSPTVKTDGHDFIVIFSNREDPYLTKFCLVDGSTGQAEGLSTGDWWGVSDRFHDC